MAPVSIPRQLQSMALILEPQDSEPPILSGNTRAAVYNWFVELNAGEELQALGVAPRRKAMFYGPPGTGKTTLAHHMAARRGQTLIVVDMQRVISKYVGATGGNIADLFDAYEEVHERAVLFLDEFDSVASKRTEQNTSAGKEFNNIVNAMLTRFERAKGMVIGATNMKDNVDPAIWRRFDMQLEIGLPDADARFAILKRYLAPMELPDDDTDLLCDALDKATPALIRGFAEGIKRDLVIAGKIKLKTDALSVMGRVIAGVTPHSEQDQPPLWASWDRWEKALGEMTWPPVVPPKSGEGK